MSEYKKKLIEVSLPLEAINRESAREKQPFTSNHPRSLHVYWARRPLAACRAVLFAQLVDDPSAHPEKFPTEEDQAKERQRLFGIIERLVVWENIYDEALLKEAHDEILKSTDGNPPAILDPFAGGGSIPLEAQRLGLQAYASDLNPVAVLINKALIEIPPKWDGQPPVFPGAAEQRLDWSKATGLAEDVRRYGQWMRDEAETRIGHLYPKVTLPDGSEASVTAWIWARTITCPNPACGIRMPLVRSWWLGKKKGKEAYVIPSVVHDSDGQPRIDFAIGHDLKRAPAKDNDGTVGRTGASCIACRTAVPLKDVRAKAREGDMGEQLMAVVAEGDRRRHYLAPSDDHVQAALVPMPPDIPEAEMPEASLGFRTQAYGMSRYSDLFTPRQLTALTTFSDLVGEVRERARRDAVAAGLPDDEVGLEAAGTDASAYADSVAVYLSLALGRYTDICNAFTSWNASNENVRALFSRQAIPMVWDFSEANPFGRVGIGGTLSTSPDVLARLPASIPGHAELQGAASRAYGKCVVSTDPPYYDNIGYANLSDFFYTWLRRSLLGLMPSLFQTAQTPKAEELIADPYRHGNKQQASNFFETGFNDVFLRIRAETPQDFPITVFYAFKQGESDETGIGNTGWQTLLEGMLSSGWEVTATWPVRTERSERSVSLGANALASSIVLALRPRSEHAEAIVRRSFIAALKDELPLALRKLQQGSIAPVDLAQAAIGPGMEVFSRYSRVVEADGSDMSVRTALALINQVLDEVLAEQEGDFDVETRFCVKWFSQFGWSEASSGEADILTRAVDTSVTRLERGGVFRAAAGKSRLLEPSEMPSDWDPALDKDISVWEVALRIAHALQVDGAERAGEWMAAASSRVDMDAVKELSYLLYSICEKKGWTDSALLFNALGTSWSDLSTVARAPTTTSAQQGAFDLDAEDEGE